MEFSILESLEQYGYVVTDKIMGCKKPSLHSTSISRLVFLIHQVSVNDKSN